MLVFIKVTDYNKIVKKDKSARRWSVAMTEKKHAIKPYPLGAHVEDGAIRFAYASGKKDCGIILYDRESGKKLHKIPFRREERMGNVYCKYLELDPQQIGYQFYEEERIVPDLHARGFLSKPVYGKTRKNVNRIAVFPGEDFDWEQDEHPMLSYRESVCYCMHVRGFTMHASSKVTTPESRFCPQCGMQLAPTATFCGNCGETGLSAGNRHHDGGIAACL